jgi:hypothetical protein
MKYVKQLENVGLEQSMEGGGGPNKSLNKQDHMKFL